MSLSSYLNKAAQVISRENGVGFSTLLQTSPSTPSSSLQHFSPQSVRQHFHGSRIPADFVNLLASHLTSVAYERAGDLPKAFTSKLECAKEFQRLLGDENVLWLLPPLFTLIGKLRTLAGAADRLLVKRGEKAESRQEAARALFGLFRVCNMDRSAIEVSKKLSILRITNNLFNLYFDMNNIAQCKSLIDIVEGPGCVPFANFVMHDRVTYKFHVGRLEMYKGNFSQARKSLAFAFSKCPTSSKKNKRLILLYFITVRVLIGEFPKPTLLKKYNLLQFTQIFKAVRTGNLRAFNQAMIDNEAFLIQKGIFIILERLRALCLRNLIRRIGKELNTTQISLVTVFKVCEWLGVEGASLSGVEGLVANLIFQGKVKGYISHQHSVLVVSSRDPFPSLS